MVQNRTEWSKDLQMGQGFTMNHPESFYQLCGAKMHSTNACTKVCHVCSAGWINLEKYRDGHYQDQKQPKFESSKNQPLT